MGYLSTVGFVLPPVSVIPATALYPPAWAECTMRPWDERTGFLVESCYFVPLFRSFGGINPSIKITMAQLDKRIDAYIARSADFAKPILTHLRALVHKACPKVEETVKWGFPHFDYKGMFCSMASFKSHCAFGFWKAALMKDKVLMENAKAETAMGHLGKIQSLADLPADTTLLQWMKEAM